MHKQTHTHTHLYVTGEFLHEELVNEEFEEKAGSVRSKEMGVIALALGKGTGTKLKMEEGRERGRERWWWESGSEWGWRDWVKMRRMVGRKERVKLGVRRWEWQGGNTICKRDRVRGKERVTRQGEEQREKNKWNSIYCPSKPQTNENHSIMRWININWRKASPNWTEPILLNDATWYTAPTVHVRTCNDHAHQPLLLYLNSRCHSCHYHVHVYVIMSPCSRQHTCTCNCFMHSNTPIQQPFLILFY